jgi:pre-mRNA-processing factor 6
VDKGDYSDRAFDEFSGFQEQLFSDTPYDAEDKEADDIYSSVDDHMDSRRKRRREEMEKEARTVDAWRRSRLTSCVSTMTSLWCVCLCVSCRR